MRSIADLYARVLGQPRLLLRLGGVALLALITYQLALVVFLNWLISNVEPRASGRITDPYALILIAVYLFYVAIYVWFLAFFSVRWHRYALVGRQHYRLFEISFGTRERRFIRKSMLIALMLVGIGLIYAILVVASLAIAGNILIENNNNSQI